MLLDEPTNHLDISSQEVLQEAMAQYEGTIIVVSHNRFFANSFVNKVLEIRDGRATIYEGNVDDYLERRRKEQARGDRVKEPAPAADDGEIRPEPDVQQLDRKALRREKALMREKLGKKLNPLKTKVRKAEEQIEQLETRKQQLEAIMADPDLYQDQESWAKVSREYAGLERRLERNYAQWEEAQEMIEAIEGSSFE